MEAMHEEMKSLNENKTWKSMDLPDGKNVIGSKWVCKRKLNDHNEVVGYKARLVARGFNQKFGTDYDEGFAPVMRSSSFRMLLAVSA